MRETDKMLRILHKQLVLLQKGNVRVCVLGIVRHGVTMGARNVEEQGRNDDKRRCSPQGQVPYSALRRKFERCQTASTGAQGRVLRVEQVPSSCTESNELIFLLLLCLGRVTASTEWSKAGCLSAERRCAVVLFVLITATSPVAPAAVHVSVRRVG